MRRRAPILSAVLTMAGCGSSPLISIPPDLHVPAELVFSPAYTGYPSVAELVVENRSRTGEVLVVVDSGGLKADRAELVVDAAGTATVAFRWTPIAPGEASGQLLVRSRQADHWIQWRGIAEAPPTCAPNPCASTWFDPAKGGCGLAPLPDGTPCEDGACVESAVCIAGLCRGVAPSCDDAIACTRDVCAREAGCQQLPEHTLCEAPADPCRAAVCDPAVGCVVIDLPDGVPCGPGDCASELVCQARVCVRRPVAAPDGAACAGACGAGECVDGACIDRGTELEVLWASTLSPGAQLASPSPGVVVDPLGRSHWIEYGKELGIWASGVDANGRPIGRVQVLEPARLSRWRSLPWEVAWAGEKLVSWSSEWVSGVSPGRGLDWLLGARALLGGAPGEYPNVLDVAVVPGAIWITLAPAVASESSRSWLVLLDEGGRERWRHELEGVASNVVGDTEGRAFVSVDPHQVVAFSLDGEELWRAPGETALAAATSRALVLGDCEMLHPHSGERIAPGTGGSTSCLGGQRPTEVAGAVLQHWEGHIQVRQPNGVPRPLADLQLQDPARVHHGVSWGGLALAEDSLLVAVSERDELGYHTIVGEVGLDGTVRRQCTIRDGFVFRPRAVRDSVVIGFARQETFPWETEIRAYRLTGAHEPAGGWTTSFGSSCGGASAR